MKWQRVLFWAVFLLLSAIVLDMLIGQKVASEDVMRWSDRLRNGGGILFGLAGLLWILEKVGLRVAGARCRACRKPIAHGKTYCADDMRKFVEQGRERLHQHRGSGV